MIEIAGISIPIKVDAGGVSAGLQQAGTAVKTFGKDLEKTGTDAKTLGTNMTTSSTAVKDSGMKMEGSLKGLALGMSQTMTSAFSLYQSFDNIEKKQYALEKAHLAAKKATEAVDQAQKDYNESVEKYGADSIEAQDALDKLNLSKEAAALADEREKISQDNVNDSMTMAALTVIPGVISGFDGLARSWKTFSNLDPGGLAGKLKDAFSALGTDKIGILAGVGLGIGSIFTTFKALTAKTKEEKEVYTGLAMVFNALTVATWALNAAKAFGVALTPIVGVGIVAAAGVAALATYALASQFGVDLEKPSEVPSPGTTPAPTATPKTPAEKYGDLYGGEYGVGEFGGAVPLAADITRTTETGSYSAIGWVPKHETLIHEKGIAYVITKGKNAGKFLWNRPGPMFGQYLTEDDLKRIRSKNYLEDREQDIRPWITYGWERDKDDMGNTVLVGLHLQKGGLVLGDTLGMIHRDEAVLPLTDTRAMDAIAAAIGGGGGTTIINNFYIDGSKDVDLVFGEIANRMRTIRGVGH